MRQGMRLTTVTGLLVASGLLTPSFHLQADDLFHSSPDVPQVLTATRLRQPSTEVPGSVTVIDRELIRASGARTIPELLRLVPGMKVGYRNGNQVNVNYHGTSITEARRMQVLVDGRSVYRPGLASVDWADIPVALEDIERIEVFRGPNTVTYGANALQAVVNILTRNPQDSLGTRTKATIGERGVREFYGSHGFNQGNASVRLSVGSRQFDGFDERADGSPYHNGSRAEYFNISALHSLADEQTLEWQLGAKQGENERPLEDFGLTDPDVEAEDYFALLRWKAQLTDQHALQVQGYLQQQNRHQDWRTTVPIPLFDPSLGKLYQINPDLANAAVKNPLVTGSNATENALLTAYRSTVLANCTFAPSAVCNQSTGTTQARTHERRGDIELQDTWKPSEDWSLVSGIGLRQDRAESQTFLGGTVTNDSWRLFSNAEWRFAPNWLLNLGGMHEHDDLSGSSFSPRIALNWLLHPDQSLRAVYSEAVRRPDMFEQKAEWSYQGRGMSPLIAGSSTATYYQVARAQGSLNPEHIHASELGWNAFWSPWQLSTDLRLFYEELHQQISEPLRLDDFNPSNDSQSRFHGAEGQLDWQASTEDRLRLTYAYIDNSASNKIDRRLTARHSGSAGWMRDWQNNWHSSVFYYAADQLNEYAFARTDWRVAKRFNLAQGQRLELALMWQFRLDDEPLTWSENHYESRSQWLLSAELDF
ncbi:TonB-dependent receptor plug domain-containing protein [Atopomonas sediminilitoris]|uniref:TonB-dependent receptor plug domain-containing protein n=1 Tax=Atopomonas sediminilitoris TaxID=2919919 RepID=UPI001F4E6A19|nr:TonB-dependent receptor [Atopomonas sediminilitoris]MCJ8167771.1 TonB-dependent receptor [Atopomonas sediminilitoris]